MAASRDRCYFICLQKVPSNSGHWATKCISHDSKPTKAGSEKFITKGNIDGNKISESKYLRLYCN